MGTSIFPQRTNPTTSFIVNMFLSFQDRDNLYLVMDLLKGGDLRYHIARRKRFTEKETRNFPFYLPHPTSSLEFFIACMLKGLEYLHMNGIIHRDIKPENIVLEESGYLRITDLGIARV